MKLREVCKITSGQNAPQASSDYQIGGKTFIKVSDLDNVIFDDNESRSCKVTDDAINEYKLKLFPAGSIVFAKSGLSCVKNRVYLLKKPSYIVNHLCVLYNFKIQINHLWLLYYLKAFNVTKLIKDFSYPSIKLSEIGEIDIPTIPLEKQNKIVEEITELNNLYKNRLSDLNSFDELIKSRFIELFMDGDKDKYPLSKWEEVVTIKHGKDYKKNVAESGGYPVYGSGGFMGVYANNYLVNENATIIGRKGTIDKPIFVNEKFWNVDTAFGIEVNKKILNPLFFFIRSTLYDLKAFSTSTTLPSMTKDTLHKITIGIPPLELQNKFAGFVIQIDKSKFVVQKQIKDLKELLDKKMDEYFGG